MIHVKKTSMTGKALLQMQDGRLIAYRKGSLVVYKDEHLIKKLALPSVIWKRIACKVRLLERALHTDVRWATEISDQEILLLYQHAVYKVNLKTDTLKFEFGGFRGQPFSVIHFKDRILFGDYGGNEKREQVNIYERIGETWKIVYSFPAGQIRHIHNIVPTHDGFYILTGDEDSESGIWKANDDFSIVEPFLIGKQQYRCCQMLPDGEDTGWYVSDAPSEPNWLYHYSGHDVTPICRISGTAIYGTQFNNGLVFSTTVEPEAHAKNKFDYWLSRKPGTGIIGTETKVFVLQKGEIMEIASYKHDGKPLRLFQYATVYFSRFKKNQIFFTPCGVIKDNKIFEVIDL